MSIVLIVPVVLQVAASIPPAPPAPPAPSAVPARLGFPLMVRPGSPEESFQVELKLRAPGTTLADELLRVGTRSGSTWQKSRTEPADQSCPAVQLPQPTRSEISVTLQPARQFGVAGDSSDTTGTTMVTIRWSRPAPGQCGGVRTVETRGIIELRPGRPVSIEGDGGLTAELRRR